MTSDAAERSRELLAAGRTSEAIDLLAGVIAQGGGSPTIRAVYGYALYHGGRIADAHSVLSAAVAQFPFDPSLHEAMARIRWMSGEGETFADAFLAAIASRPSDLMLRLKCAELLRLSGDRGKSERLLREAMASRPGDPTIAAWLGVLYDEMGRLPEALPLLTLAANTFPNEPTPRLNLAHTLLRMGRPEDALKELDRVFALERGNHLAITYEGMALKQLGDPKYRWLFDYDRYVQPYDLEAPKGYGSVADFNAALASRLRELQDASAHPLEQSLRGGSQTSHNLIQGDDPMLRQYFAALDEPIRSYIASLGNDREHPLEGRKTSGHRLSGCWSVLLRPGGFHVNHTHPMGWISSSYYVSLPPSMGADTQEGWIKFGEPRWPTPGCGVERVIQPKEGRLVLFPSYMWHGTIPFSSGERLTAPFDVVPA